MESESLLVGGLNGAMYQRKYRCSQRWPLSCRSQHNPKSCQKSSRWQANIPRKMHATDSPFSGLTPMMETPVKTSWGSQNRFKPRTRFIVGFITIVHRVVACITQNYCSPGLLSILGMTVMNNFSVLETMATPSSHASFEGEQAG